MTERFLELSQEEKKASLEAVQKFLAKHFSAYVVIACSKPSHSGEMQAEMLYEGEGTLLSYLVDNAQQILENPKGVTQNSSEYLL